MIGQYLLNKNESAIVPYPKKFWELNKAGQVSLSVASTINGLLPALSPLTVINIAIA